MAARFTSRWPAARIRTRSSGTERGGVTTRAAADDKHVAFDIGHTIHPHPTLGESIGMAAEVFEGVCTDLPPQKKR